MREVIEEYLHAYVYEDVVPNLEEALDEVSKEAVKRLKDASPKRAGGSKKYAKGWSRQRDKARIRVGWTIYNKVSGLPHLLENGHAKRNGGRTRPIVHIAPVEAWAVEEAEDRFIHKMEGT